MGGHLPTSANAGGCKSAYDDNGAVGEADYLLRDAPEKEARHPAMTAAADDDWIGFAVAGCRNDLLGRVAQRWLGQDPRGTPRERLPASIIENIIGHSEGELCRGYRNMLGARVFFDRRTELWRAISNDPQQDQLGIVFTRQISSEIDCFERGRRIVDPDQNAFHGSSPTPQISGQNYLGI